VAILLVGTLFYHFAENFKWLDALYFSVIALTTAGFGDITPVTDLGKAFTIVYMITGIGIMLNFLNVFYEKRQQNRQQMKKKIDKKRTKKSDHV
jgi:hypothetical protein